MGNVTAKTSGEIASFMTPAKTNIKSLKVHFSPKQLGTGDPSPENVREIEGWDGVEVNGSGKNLVPWISTRYICTANHYNGNADWSNPWKIPDRTKQYTYSVFIDNTNGKNPCCCKIWFKNEDNTAFVDGTASLSIEKVPVGSCKRIYKTIIAKENTYYFVFGLELYKGCVASNPIVYETSQKDSVSYQWKLPDEYQEVEYITSEIKSGSHPYINTGIIPNENMRIYLEGVTGDDVNGAGFLFGSRTKPSSATTGRFWGITWQNQYRYGYINNSNSVIKPSLINEEFIFDFNYNSEHSVFVNDTTVKPTNITNDEYVLPIFLFGINNGGLIDTGQQRSFSVKKFIIYNDYNDIEPIMSLVPCYRKSDNEIGMYDTVSQMFYVNQGTGTFLKGSDIDKTFYGGYVDLISGELVEEWKYLNLDNLKWNTTSQVSVFRSDDLINYYVSNITNFICNKYTTTPRASTSITNMQDLNIKAHDINDKFIYIKNTNYTDATEFKSSLIDCNMVYLFAEPITHQLTPTQLQSFVGQNNFWSNADYVEVEYDLIETIDIQKARQKIILNQPQLKTISDKIVSFNTDMVAPMKNCKIYFNPIQLGTGDPSSTNIRNINGWISIDSYVNGDKISVDWTNDAGTIYGGYLDLAKGEVVATYALFDAYQNRSLFTQGDGNVYIANNQFATYGFVKPININESISTHFKAADITTESYPSFSVSNMGHFAVRGIPNVTDTVEHFTTYIEEQMNNNTPVQFVMPLVTPIIYQLTSQQLLTLKSTNHIWSETNGQQIDITYWTRKNLTPVPLTNYLENQTWTDSAYISSTGKKTINGTSASHFLTNQILLEAGTYVLSGFSYYAGSDSTRYRIHAYDSTGKWVKQITFQEIDNLSPVDISFTLDTDTYVNLSIAMDFDGVLTKIN